MKSTLFLCTLVLAGSAFVGAQQTSSPTTPPGSTPPTFPSDQGTRSSPDMPAPAPSTDTPHSGSNSSTSSASQTGSADNMSTNIEGCLSQASSGGAFTLADSSGNSYMLQGDTAKLAKHVGEEVRVDGSMTQSSASSSSTTPDSSASSASPSGSASATPDSSSSASASKFFHVQSVNTIAKSCSNIQQK